MDTEKLWTLQELAKKFKPRKSISTWRRMIRDGKVLPRRVGSGRGMIYIPDSEVRRLVNGER